MVAQANPTVRVSTCTVTRYGCHLAQQQKEPNNRLLVHSRSTRALDRLSISVRTHHIRSQGTQPLKTNASVASIESRLPNSRSPNLQHMHVTTDSSGLWAGWVTNPLGPCFLEGARAPSKPQPLQALALPLVITAPVNRAQSELLKIGQYWSPPPPGPTR